MTANEICPIAKLERILLATDGSEFSEGAVREAIGFAKSCSSTLYAMSVIETNPEFEAYAPGAVEKMEKETLELLDQIKKRAQDKGITCEGVTRRGEDAHKYIIEEAARLNADMIVVGRRGRRGMQKLMMGSVTALVIDKAPCNVFIVPRMAKLSCEKILIATDGSEYSKKAITEGLSIAKRCGSEVKAISVAHKEGDLGEAEENVKAVVDMGKNEGISVESLVVTGTPYESIVSVAREKNVDLIVVGTHGRTGLKRLIMGSVAERVIATADCTIMVIK
jgi:nucleotide-binding universal stress UspA family protein